MSGHAQVDALSDAELKAMLEECNVKVGPIVASTRDLYRKKLVKILNGSRENNETLQDSVGGYEASLESSDLEEFLRQEHEKEVSARFRSRYRVGTDYPKPETIYPIKTKNIRESDAVTIQLYLIVILVVAIICLCIYCYVSWNTGSASDAYDAIEAAAKEALKETIQK